ncbi:MAG: insulinase family protein [Spirochaeta sp.]
MKETESPAAGFTLRETIEIQEFNAVGTWWVHDTTHCEVFHLHCDDPENMFAFGFPTVPADSTGVAHILEHTVLCGSRQFPLKDPFLRMLQSSVYTFLNAFTFPDKTVYPAASTVDKDLFNLMKVYGDAVFFPLLDPAMFRQEGHRLIYDENGELDISGVVYNEMLGAFSSQESVEMRLCLNGLFPDTAYGYESGGDPDEIPKLTYEQFVAFHRVHYHPRNARIFLYGNIPAKRYLEFLEQEFLGHFQAGSKPNPIGVQPRWNEPRRIIQQVPGEGDPETASSVTMNWLLFPSTDVEQVIAFEVLAEVLLGTPGSPLQKRLLESGLGEDLSSPSGYESEIYETMFSVGLRGTSTERIIEIEEFVLRSLQEIINEGLDPDLVEGTLRRFEFRTRELGSGGNVGLHLMRRAYQGWMHGSAPWETLEFASVFGKLRRNIEADPSYLTGLMQRHLVENTHRLTVAVVPDTARGTEELEQRRACIAQIEAKHTAGDRERIAREEAELRAFQERPDPEAEVASLPHLELNDVPRDIRLIPQEVIQLRDGVPCYTTALDSRGIIYLNVAVEVGDLEGDAELLLPFLSSTLTGLGIPGVPYDQMSHRVGLVFGTIRTDVEVTDHAETQQPHAILWLRTRFLAQYADEALELIDDILCRIDFSDTGRLREMLVEQRNDYRSSVVQNGSSFASLRAEAGLSRIELKEERLKGITQYLFLDALLKQPIESVRTALERLRDGIICRCRTEIQLSCDSDQVHEMVGRLPRRLGGIWSREHSTVPKITAVPDFVEPGLPGVGNPEALVTSTTVNYLAMALPGSLVFQPGFAAQSMISHLLSTSYLWERCRMQGGAYGASAALNGLSGIFRFVTYRDPQTTATLQIFLDAFRTMNQQLLDPGLIETAIIALVGKDLRPMSPGAQGLMAYRRRKFGITDDLRQENRDRLLGLTPQQIADQLEELGSALEQAVVSMVTSQENLKQIGTGSSPAEQLMQRAAGNRITIISG